MGWLLLVSFLGGFCSVETGLAQSSLPVVGAEEVLADSQGIAHVNISLSSAGNPISAVQFDLQYSDQMLGGTVAPGSVVTGAVKSLATSQPGQQRVRVLIYGLNQNPISDGVLATFTLQVGGGVAPGKYPVAIQNVVLSNPAGNAVFARTVDGSVSVAVGVNSPMSITAVVNAASYLPGAVAPGEILVIQGSGLGADGTTAMSPTADGLAPATLAGTRVLFDGVAAPMIYTSPNQVSAVVPYGVDGKTETALQLQYNNTQSAVVRLRVVSSAPGIFTSDSSGKGQAAAINPDDSINGPESPAAPGSVVTLFATGEGQTSPLGVDGLIARSSGLWRPVLPVGASVGGVAAEVVDAGSVEGQVAGLLQVRLRIPDSVGAGQAVPVTVTVGQASQAGVTISIQ